MEVTIESEIRECMEIDHSDTCTIEYEIFIKFVTLKFDPSFLSAELSKKLRLLRQLKVNSLVTSTSSFMYSIFSILVADIVNAIQTDFEKQKLKRVSLEKERQDKKEALEILSCNATLHSEIATAVTTHSNWLFKQLAQHASEVSALKSFADLCQREQENFQQIIAEGNSMPTPPLCRTAKAIST